MPDPRWLTREDAARPKAFTVAQLAKHWGVGTSTVYDLCARRKLGHIRIGATIRIRPEDVEAYEAQTWHAPETLSQTSASPSAAADSMSPGGRTGAASAFQRGRRISGQRVGS
jgi:excisionase family DNA binding protein